MKVLINEDLPEVLRLELPSHEVFTVGYMGWKGVRNGNLMRQAVAGGFDVLLTRDQGFAHQRPTEAAGICIIVIQIGRRRWKDLIPHCDRIRRAVDHSTPGSVSHVTDAV